MASLEDTLGAIGYAKVICVLAPGASLMPPAGYGAGPLETSLDESFVIPNEALAESLDGAARRAMPPMQGGRRGRLKPADWMSKVKVFPHLNLAIGYADRKSVEALRSDARIERVVEAPELSLIRPTSVVVAAPAPGPTWGISRLNVPALWAAGVTGEGVVVGHVDTGIDATHASLGGALHGFVEYDLVGRAVPDAAARDSGEHGTHTAGIVAGRAAGSARFGVAPGCHLASALAIEGGQVIDRILGGLDWIVGEGARILSMSLGLRGYTPAFQAIIDALLKANVLPIVAVGNEFANTSRSPGNYPNVISVGACGPDDTVPDFSSSQSFARADDPIVPDLVAPGVSIVSCMPQNGFAEMDGSSMATPHVAGLAALLLGALPTATASDLQAAIFASCRRPATMPPERGNRGIPDAVAAYAELVGAPVPAAVA